MEDVGFEVRDEVDKVFQDAVLLEVVDNGDRVRRIRFDATIQERGCRFELEALSKDSRFYR